MDNITFVGLDVHKATVCVAMAESGRDGEVRQVGVFEHRPEVLSRMVTRFGRNDRRLSFCYEAGPCGYGLQRLLTGAGHECMVVAPSLIPIKASDRVKTDRRDATLLAKLHRAGELTAIWVPDLTHEAMRDLVRARATAVRTLGKARQHLQGFLLRHDLLRLRHLCRLGWSAAGNAPRRARPAPRRSRMPRGRRSQPMPAPRTTPRIETPLSRRMARRFWSRKRRCCWRLASPNSPGVAWDKGCYMGQKLTARTKYRGLVKRRLVPVAFTAPPLAHW